MQTIERWLDESAGVGEPTLADLRIAVIHASPYWSAEGELLYPQDRTALVIEIDELIERCGASACVRDFVEGRRA